jgi:hypothetical protein
MKKKPTIFLFLCILLIFTPNNIIQTQAAQTTLQLIPGMVYEFSHNDPRTISYITVPGTTRYEYVSYDQHGAVVEFGISGGRCPVRGGGLTRLSVHNAVSVSFDSTRISVTSSTGAAIFRLPIPEGKTVTLSNVSTDRITVSIDNSGRDSLALYDCVVRDNEGIVNFYALQSRFTNQNIPALGSATFTAGAGGMTLMFPADSAVTPKDETRAALVTVPLTAGKSRTLTNNHTLPYELSLLTKSTFFYDYTLWDTKGYAIDQGNNEQGTKISITPGNSLFFTPKNEATLFFPSDWQHRLTLAEGGETVSGLYELLPGQHLHITNASLEQSYDIRINNKQAYREFMYDFALLDGTETRYGKERRDGMVSLPPGSEITLTSVSDDNEIIEVRLPSASPLTARYTDEKAVGSYMLLPGASATFVNKNENIYRITPQSEATQGTMDFVQKDSTGTIVDYGRVPLHQVINLETAHIWLLTNTEQSPVEFIFPFKWSNEGLTVTASETEALCFTLVGENTTIQVNNLDRQYVSHLRTAGENTIALFDYVLTDGKNAVTEYGVNTGGELTIPAAGKLTIMPQKGSVLALYYPAEWKETSLRNADASGTPLFRATYKPGSRFTMQNRTKGKNAMIFEVQNNSVNTAAAYFVRENRDNTRIGANEQPISGFIYIPEETILTLTVATGADLEIWLPHNWARQLIR